MVWSHLVFSKWVARVFSLLIAFILWQYVYFQDRVVEQIVFPLEFDNYPDHLYTDPGNISGKMVIAQISGKKNKIREVYSILNKIRFYANLANSKNGYNKYEITFDRNSSVDLALDNVRLEFKNRFVYIPFQKKIKKNIPIKLIMDESFRKKFSEIGVIDYSPREALIYGPENAVNDIGYVKSRFFNFKNKYGNFKLSLPLQKLKNPLRIIRPKNINVFVKFNSNIQDMKFKNINIMLVNNLKNFDVLNKNVLTLQYIVYRGPENIIKKINWRSLVAYVDLHDYKKDGKYLAFVHPQEFEHLEVIDYAPKQIRIKLVEKKLF